MLSPFPPTTSNPGHGSIHLTLLPPSTPTFSNLTYTYPLKLVPSIPHTISPPSNATASSVDKRTTRHPLKPTTCPLLFMLNYGGGLLAGDNVSLTIDLDAGTRLAITTQGTTKIFKPPSPSSSSPTPAPALATQTLNARVSPHAALWLAPDPVQPFAESHYAQTQIFEVEEEGSVGLVDWVVEGRKANGESWSLGSCRGRNEIWEIHHHTDTGQREETLLETTMEEREEKTKKRNRLLVRDAVVLEQPGVRLRMCGKGVFGTILLRGPLFTSLANFFVQEFGLLPRLGGRNWSPTSDDGGGEKLSTTEIWRKKRMALEKEQSLLWTACHVRGCTIVKFMAPEVERARVWLGNMLKEEGTVGREFGEGGLMFVR
ncbi:MAG: hypothetical protein Q9217_002895 [Psora testacea]